ncbi:hypothetical protein [Microcoleus sp. S13_B4]|uniref:hypothetical protein n=1 Tax=Microcoleus sp. S13_B4 TaxID=3055408 RepID=UPI002FD556E7
MLTDLILFPLDAEIIPLNLPVSAVSFPSNFSPPCKKLFFSHIMKNQPFFWGKKLDTGGLTRYYLIMGIVPQFKFISPLPLSKIYPKSQFKSIGKNSFLCAAI